MASRFIRLQDLASLLERRSDGLRRWLATNDVAVTTRQGEPSVEWNTLLRRLDAETISAIRTAAKRRAFDLERHTWTVASFPKLLKLWDKKRNVGRKPNEVTYRSKSPVWWKCPVASNHVWDEAPASRLKKYVDTPYRVLGCPFCSRHRTTPDHSLASEYPKLARQWHPKLNGKLRPKDVAPRSAKMAWWRCAKRHEWKAKISNRTINGRGCPYCAGQALVPERSLSARAPARAAQWHPTKNGELKPADIALRSTRMVWWKCPKGSDHEWQQSPDGRANSPGCPFCSSARVSKDNCLATNHPDLAREWHSTRNGSLSPRDVTAKANRSVWWKCPKGADHEWRCGINNRSRLGSGCPFCTGRRASRANNLAVVFPKIANQWHPRKNGALKPSDMTPRSGRMVWWKCRKGSDHEWRCAVSYRSAVKSGCPFCAGLRVSKTNCLATVYPKIARQWHPKRNGRLKPTAVIATSKSAAWWRCALGHDWFAPVHARTVLGQGCPVCTESSAIGRRRA